MMLTEKLALETSLLYIVKDTKRNRLRWITNLIRIICNLKRSLQYCI